MMVTTQYTHLTLVEPFLLTLLALLIALLIILLSLAVEVAQDHLHLVVVGLEVIELVGTLKHLVEVGLARQG